MICIYSLKEVKCMEGMTLIQTAKILMYTNSRCTVTEVHHYCLNPAFPGMYSRYKKKLEICLNSVCRVFSLERDRHKKMIPT